MRKLVACLVVFLLISGCSSSKFDPVVRVKQEILDLNSDNISDDDFTEAMFVYIHTITESLGAYFNKVSEVLYK